MSIRATSDERRRSLPGDTLIPSAAATVTHAITIAAPPEAVWPWIVQMGAGRAGWYSYDWVDNGGNPSATEIVPTLQNVMLGDIMPALPGASNSFIVARIESQRDLILTVSAGGDELAVSWEFYLAPVDQNGTRVIVRGRVNAQWPRVRTNDLPMTPRPIERVYAALARIPRWLMMPAAMYGHSIMQARQLRGIKQRAEANRTSWS